jgi:hypothetical protein
MNLDLSGNYTKYKYKKNKQERNMKSFKTHLDEDALVEALLLSEVKSQLQLAPSVSKIIFGYSE